MKWTVIFKLIEMVISQIDAEDVERMLDKGIDYIEDNFGEKPVVLQGCKLIREIASIEDNDEVTV